MVPDLADPREIADDDHSRCYADPTPHRRVGSGSQGSDRHTQFEPRADRLLSVVFVRRRVVEEDEDGIPETSGDKPAVMTDDLRDAAVKGADPFVQILENGSRCRADRFARHGGDLPTFGFIVFGWSRIPHGAPWRRRRYDDIFLLRDDRRDKSITATGQRLVPAVAAGRLAQDPTQRRNLDSEVAFYDRAAGPYHLDQLIFGDWESGPLHQDAKHADRGRPARLDGTGSPPPCRGGMGRRCKAPITPDMTPVQKHLPTFCKEIQDFQMSGDQAATHQQTG
jgi:hypothetical protein